MHSLPLKEVDLRLFFHGDYFKRTHRVIVAEDAIEHRPDAAGASAQKSSDRGFNDRAWITAQFPSHGARLRFEHAQPDSRPADCNSVGADCLDVVQQRQVENDASAERDCLSVIACSGAATTQTGSTTPRAMRTTRSSMVSSPNGSHPFGRPMRVLCPPHSTMPPTQSGRGVI